MKYKFFLLFISIFVLNSPLALAANRPTVAPAGKNTQNQQLLQNQGSDQVNKPNDVGNSQTVQQRVQACQAVEAGIKTRSMNMTQFTFKLMETLGTMNNRVEDYYQRKMQNQASTRVSNYTALKSMVQEKKMAAVSVNTQAQNSLLNFNCNSEKPAEAVQAFNANMLKVKTALKEYQGAVKNLTDAVKTAAQKGGQQ